jgi:V8-like Glu-specific endopeptidase
MLTFYASGNNQYLNCQIESGDDPFGKFSKWITVEAGTPVVFAVICDPMSGAYPSGAVTMTVTPPSGSPYNHSENSADLFVSVVTGPYVVCVVNPTPGLWEISCTCTDHTAQYRVNFFSIPTADPWDSMFYALSPYLPNDKRYRGAEINYRLFEWGMLPISAFLFAAVTAAKTQTAIDVQTLLTQIYAISAEAAQTIVTMCQSAVLVQGVTIATAQQIGAFSDLVVENVLSNGDASLGLQDWTAMPGSGNWTVLNGFADPIQYDNNFAVSSTWCKACQTVDLVNDIGFTAEYLDQAPIIVLREWIAVNYPTSSSEQSQYYLTIKLQDNNSNTIKQFGTGTIILPDVPGQTPTSLSWQAVQCSFDHYGAGVRFIYIEHGGLNPASFSADQGVLITGTTVDVSVAGPQEPTQELLQNGSAQNQLTNWTIDDGTWTVDNAAGTNCPASIGTTAFSVSASIGATKSQVIDLIAAGYTTAFLDSAPVVQFSDWMCGHPGCGCTYRWKVGLLDANMNSITSFDSGDVQMPAMATTVSPFSRYVQSLSGYDAGLRYISFEHSATPGSTTMSAMLTGASVRLPTLAVGESPPGQGVTDRPLPQDAEAVPAPVNDTSVIPYRWVCQSQQPVAGGIQSCSAWLVPSPAANVFQVVTAAHCVRLGQDGWPTSNFTVTPGAGNKAGANPYTPQEVALSQVQIALNWLLKDQATIGFSELYDYAAMYVSAPDIGWDTGGFTPTFETDVTMNGQAAVMTGFPARAPYSQTPISMYTKNVTLTANSGTQVQAGGSDFTQGASGCPVYIVNAGNYNALGVFSYISDSILRSKKMATRLTMGAVARLRRWQTPLKSTDPINKFHIVIHTGNDFGAGTDDPITWSFDGKTYNLDQVWYSGADRYFRNTNERGDYDGYNLTSMIKNNYPAGINISYLSNKNYEITLNNNKILIQFWENEWQLADVSFFINDQLYYATNVNRWLGRFNTWSDRFPDF